MSVYDERLWRDRAKSVLAQGQTGTNSKRPSQYVLGVFPTHIIKGRGCNVWAADGKKYTDFVGALGATILGYNHPNVTEAAIAEVNNGGPSFSMPNPLEIEVAEIIRSMVPAAERIRFLKTGSEACQAALRIARAASKLETVYSEGYHGWHDEFTSLTEPALGVYGSYPIRPMEKFEEGGIYITEPIMLDDSDVRRAELMEYRHNSYLTIFDEVVTGFRVNKYTVANFWGVQPDIICLGKGIANGFPLSVVAGKEGIMNCNEYFVSSTFSGDSVSLAAAKATLETLQKKRPEDLCYYGRRFMDRVNEALERIDLKIEGYGTRGMFPVTAPNAAEFMQEACDQGLLFGKAFFYTYAHMELMHEEGTLQLIHDAVDRVAKGNVKLRGERPKETFKR